MMWEQLSHDQPYIEAARPCYTYQALGWLWRMAWAIPMAWAMSHESRR